MCAFAQDYCVMSLLPLDEFGRELLNLLQEDAGQTLQELGDAIGLSAPAVQRRIRRYREAGIIKGTAAQVDPRKVGVPITVLILATLVSDNGPAVVRLHERLTKHPNVQQCYEVAGNFDLATLIVVPDMEAYRQVAEALFGKDKNVRRFVTHVIMGTIKSSLSVPL